VFSSVEDVLEQSLEHVTEPQWREMLLMTTGLLRNADSFFEMFLKKLNELAKRKSKISVLLEWSAMKTTLAQQNMHKAAAIRNFYLWLALSLNFKLDIDIDLGLDQGLPLDFNLALDGIDQNLALDLALARSREVNLDHERALYRDFDRDLARDFARARDLDIYRNRSFGRTIERSSDSPRGRGGGSRARAHKRAHAQARDRARDLAQEYDYDLARANERARDLAQDLAHAIQASKVLNLPELKNALTSLKIPDLDDTDQRWQTFVQRIDALMINHRYFQTWSFSESESNHLVYYLYVHKLFLDCLKVAKVSNLEAIENQLLLPPKQKKESGGY
jgi:hypothetical protein